MTQPRPQQPPQPTPATMSVAEAAIRLGVSKMTLYRLINKGQFPAVRLGSRLVVPVVAVREMLHKAVSLGTVVDSESWARRQPR